jgi:hypothetical protein
MARCIDQSNLDEALAEAAERQRMRSQIARYYGTELKAIRFSRSGPAGTRTCLVRLRMVCGQGVEVWFAEGFAVGIPPIKP